MPIMLRNNKKASRVAFSILGTPVNMRKTTTFRKALRDYPGVKSDARHEVHLRLNPEPLIVRR